MTENEALTVLFILHDKLKGQKLINKREDEALQKARTALESFARR